MLVKHAKNWYECEWVAVRVASLYALAQQARKLKLQHVHVRCIIALYYSYNLCICQALLNVRGVNDSS